MILRVASSRIRTVGTCLGFPGFLTSSAQRVPRAIPPIYCQSPGSGKTARRCLVSTSKPTTGGWRASLDRFLAAKEMPPRNTFAWYREMLLICTVFAITGSSTMILVRPAVSKGLGLQGSFKDGPWSYRISSLIVMSPIYGVLLVLVGTLFGRHAYFRHFSVKLFSRFGIPPEMLDPTFQQTKKTFRKW